MAEAAGVSFAVRLQGLDMAFKGAHEHRATMVRH
jgi:hypothetical protein